MSSFLPWLVVAELLGLATLPLALTIFRWLPDRGYIFSKVLGLLLVTYLTWLLGSFLPIVSSVAVPIAVAVVLAALSWWFLGAECLRTLREIGRPALVEEILFVLGLTVWSLLRAHVFGPGISHTEQPMDLMFLNSSLRSGSYPPYDAWLSGHTVNYYYFGYLMFATMTKLSGVGATVGYNLSLSFLFGFVVSGCYSLGYALTRRMSWALLAPVLVALVGNWHAMLWLLPHSVCASASVPGSFSWLFDSTRIVGHQFALGNWSCRIDNPVASDYTINEFPLFSLVLGDLHPHLMALPVVLLCLALAVNIIQRPNQLSLRRDLHSVSIWFFPALAVGALFAINSWDYPTYLLVTLICLLVHSYIVDESKQWWRTPLRIGSVLVLATLLLYLPFYLHFSSLAHGIGLVNTRSDPFEVLQVFGLLFLASGLLLASLNALLQPEEVSDEVPGSIDPLVPGVPLTPAPETGSSNIRFVSSAVGLAVAVVIASVFHFWVVALLLFFGYWSGVLLYRVANTEAPRRGDAAVLVFFIVSALVLAGTELVYIRDSFDGGASYRMNTVFKLYYQAWLLLAIGGAYGVYRSLQVLQRLSLKRETVVAAAAIAIGIAGAGIYTLYIPQYRMDSSGLVSLDGAAWIRSAHPGDYAALEWLRQHNQGNPVIAEATGDEYTYFSRISTFSGLPTMLGWGGHENQWRPGTAETAVRARDVRTLYVTTDAATARKILRHYHVRYVVVGTQERSAYPTKGGDPGLTKFARFMKLAFQSPDTRIYQF